MQASDPQEICISDIGRTGRGLVDYAMAEIMGSLELVRRDVGLIQIRRAIYQNKMGLRPTTMLWAELWRRKQGEDEWKRMDLEVAFGSLAPRSVMLETETTE